MAGASRQPEPAHRIKWRLVAAYWAAQAIVLYLGIAALITDSLDNFLEAIGEPTYAACLGTLLVAVTVLQAILLVPVSSPGRDGNKGNKRYVLLGALGTGAMAGFPALSISIVLDLTRLVDIRLLREPLLAYALGAAGGFVVGLVVLRRRAHGGVPATLRVFVLTLAARAIWLAIGFTMLGVVTLLSLGDMEDEYIGWTMLACLGVGWLVGTPLLVAFARRRDHTTVVGRLAGLLFIGTVVEAMATIPIDVMIRRKTDCYCAEGTLWALVICQAAGALALGPAIFLYPLSRRRKRWLEGRCTQCGYDLNATPAAERCPECGIGWAQELPA